MSVYIIKLNKPLQSRKWAYLPNITGASVQGNETCFGQRLSVVSLCSRTEDWDKMYFWDFDVPAF